MYHFFVEPHQIGAEEIRIEGADVNHIRNVLRMKPGEEILISSREGGDYFCRVEELEPEYVSAKILEEWENKELPARMSTSWSSILRASGADSPVPGASEGR